MSLSVFFILLGFVFQGWGVYMFLDTNKIKVTTTEYIEKVHYIDSALDSYFGVQEYNLDRVKKKMTLETK